MLTKRMRKKNNEQLPTKGCKRRLNMWWVRGLKDGGCGCPANDLIGVPKVFRKAYELGFIHGAMERKNFCRTADTWQEVA